MVPGFDDEQAFRLVLNYGVSDVWDSALNHIQ